MEHKIKWILLLMAVFIDHSFSALFFPFEDRNVEVDYKKSRSESVHRGVILSYSLAKKKQMCRDLFSKYHRKSTVIADGLKKKGEPKHDVMVKQPRWIMPEASRSDRQEDLAFLCSGRDLINMKFGDDEYEYFISSAHQPGIMFYAEPVMWNRKEILAKQYLGMSPEFVSLDQMQLEEQYVERMETMRALRAESRKYVREIEYKDDIRFLSGWQYYLICTSITSSPEHEKDRQDFPLNWDAYSDPHNMINHTYREVCLTFEDKKYKSGNWCIEVIYCRANVSSTFLALTRSYDDKDSLYVVVHRNGKFVLKEYVQNIPILINAHVPFTNVEDRFYYLHK